MRIIVVGYGVRLAIDQLTIALLRGDYPEALPLNISMVNTIFECG